MTELIRALAVLAEPPGSEQARLGEILALEGRPDRAEHTEVFAFQLYPYASVYVGAEGMLGGDARDRVAGFWAALRQVPPTEPDHLAALLGLYATLAEREDADPDPARRLLWRHGRRALLWEHLASWLFPYLDKVQEIAPPFYRAWGALLADAITDEVEAIGPPGALSAHLRAAPALPDPRREGAEAFVRGLLAPVRSGILLTRADLARAARALGLGLRMGERRLVLTALMTQDPDGTLGWLAAEARRSGAQHRAHAGVAGEVAGFWAARAARAEAQLQELRTAPGGLSQTPVPR